MPVASKVMVVLSGGQDSTYVLFWAKSVFGEVHAVSFDYGQRHKAELMAARRIAFLAEVEHEVVELGAGILQGRSPLTNPAEGLEQYENHDTMEKVIGERIELTFVPFRNPLLLTVAANRAIIKGIDTLATGVCQDDGANYPDCTEEFVDAMSDMLTTALGTVVTITAPLLHVPKQEAIARAAAIRGRYEALAWTHTAYDGLYPPTGHDHASVLRAHAFLLAGYPDPLVIRANMEGLMALPDTPNYDLREQRITDTVAALTSYIDATRGRLIAAGLL